MPSGIVPGMQQGKLETIMKGRTAGKPAEAGLNPPARADHPVAVVDSLVDVLNLSS